MQNNNPLSPHIQIYGWNISSLISISHRIVGVINFVLLIIICFWIASIFFGGASYEFIQNINIMQIYVVNKLRARLTILEWMRAE